jgi:predicted small lipoprotein YifL
MTARARAALALAVLLTMLGSAGCGRKAMPEPRHADRSSTATLIGAR